MNDMDLAFMWLEDARSEEFSHESNHDIRLFIRHVLIELTKKPPDDLQNLAKELARNVVFFARTNSYDFSVAHTEHAVLEALQSVQRAEREKAEGLRAALEAFVDNSYAPESNCSCHLSPPCRDCVEFGGIRELIAEGQKALAAYEASKEKPE